MGQMSLRFATEIRHSLHGMLGFLELAVREPLSVRQAVYLEKCRNGADRLLRVAGDLCELSQTETSPPETSDFLVKTALTEVVDLTRDMAHHAGLVLECNWPDKDLRVSGPIGLVQDMLRRLLDNAIQYTQKGTIRVSANVRANGQSAALLLEVSDPGPGIRGNVLEALRSDADGLPEQGLSLAVIRGRLKKMNGEFSIVSNAAEGTTIRLVIPISLPHTAEAEGSATAQDSGRRPMRILVAEDSDDGYFVFEEFTYGTGHYLTRAWDGIQAVEMARSAEYDLIVMDANMPLKNGYLATREIREWESDTAQSRRTPILLFSADDPLKQSKLGATAGCSGYLAKPATKDEVLRALEFFSPKR